MQRQGNLPKKKIINHSDLPIFLNPFVSKRYQNTDFQMTYPNQIDRTIGLTKSKKLDLNKKKRNTDKKIKTGSMNLFYFDQTFLLLVLLKKQQINHQWIQNDDPQIKFSFSYFFFIAFLKKVQIWKDTLLKLKKFETFFRFDFWIQEAEKRSFFLNNNQIIDGNPFSVTGSIFYFLNQYKQKQIQIRSGHNGLICKKATERDFLKPIKKNIWSPKTKHRLVARRLFILRLIKLTTKKRISQKNVTVYFKWVTPFQMKTLKIADFPFSFLYLFGACLSYLPMYTHYYTCSPGVSYKNQYPISKSLDSFFRFAKKQSKFTSLIKKRYKQRINQKENNRKKLMKQRHKNWAMSPNFGLIQNFIQHWLTLNFFDRKSKGSKEEKRSFLMKSNFNKIPLAVYNFLNIHLLKNQKQGKITDFKEFIQKMYEDRLFFDFNQSERKISNLSLFFLCTAFFYYFDFLIKNYTFFSFARLQSLLVSTGVLQSPFIYKQNQAGLVRLNGKKLTVIQSKRMPKMNKKKIQWNQTYSKLIQQQFFFFDLTNHAKKKLEKLKLLKDQYVQLEILIKLLKNQKQGSLPQTFRFRNHGTTLKSLQKFVKRKFLKNQPLSLQRQGKQCQNKKLNDSTQMNVYKKVDDSFLNQTLKRKQKQLNKSDWVFLTFNPNLLNMATIQRPGRINVSKSEFTNFTNFTTFQTFFSASLFRFSQSYDSWFFEIKHLQTIKQNPLFSIFTSLQDLNKKNRFEAFLKNKEFIKHSTDFFTTYLEQQFFTHSPSLLHVDLFNSNFKEREQKRFYQLLLFYAQRIGLTIKNPRSTSRLSGSSKGSKINRFKQKKVNLQKVNNYLRLIFLKKAKLPLIFSNIDLHTVGSINHKERTETNRVMNNMDHQHRLVMMNSNHIYFSPDSRYRPELVIQSIQIQTNRAKKTKKTNRTNSFLCKGNDPYLIFVSKTDYLFSIIQKASVFSTTDFKMKKILKSDPKFKKLRTWNSMTNLSKKNHFNPISKRISKNEIPVQMPLLEYNLVSPSTQLFLKKPEHWTTVLKEFNKNYPCQTSIDSMANHQKAIKLGKQSQVWYHSRAKMDACVFIQLFFKKNEQLIFPDDLVNFATFKKINRNGLFYTNRPIMNTKPSSRFNALNSILKCSPAKNQENFPSKHGFDFGKKDQKRLGNSKKELSSVKGEIIHRLMLKDRAKYDDSTSLKSNLLKYKKQDFVHLSYLTTEDVITYKSPELLLTQKPWPLSAKSPFGLSSNSKGELFEKQGQKRKWEKNIGALVAYGEQVTRDRVLSHAGQIIYLTKNRLLLRHAQSFLLSSGSVCNLHQGDYVSYGAPLLTVSYSNVQTEDIIQGIPKIDQLFEAKTRRGFVNLKELLQKRSSEFRGLTARLDFCPRPGAVKSIEFIQKYIVQAIQNVYQSQGVNISDKHIEIIVKQMTSKVKILEDGGSGFLPGEIVNFNSIKLENVEKKFKKLDYEPILFGITQASLNVNGFLSAASFQETVRVLSRAAIFRKTDFLKGLKENIIVGHLLPAGTGYLGLTELLRDLVAEEFLEFDMQIDKISFFTKYKDLIQKYHG